METRGRNLAALAARFGETGAQRHAAAKSTTDALGA
jgi:hypothetical protein